VPPNSVRCTRTVHLRTLHLWVSVAALRYNSPDCLVCHRTVRCTSLATATSATVDSNRHMQTLQCADSARRSQSSRQRRTSSEQCLSGATRRQSSNGRLRPNLNSWVTWLVHQTVSGGASDCPVAHRTVRCAYRQQPPQRLFWWLRAINTPNHLHSNHPSIHHSPFNTRAKCNTPRNKSKPPIRSKSPIQF
jgi:hypothetical protein